jgi:hypothetical protein
MDLEERNMQIRLMRAIYSGTHQVLVYLGESRDGSDMVMRWLEDTYVPMNYQIRDHVFAAWTRAAQNPGTFAFPPDQEFWEAFCERPWFRRTWVLHEIMSAQNIEVCCGEMRIQWEALAQCNNSIDKYVENHHYPHRISVPVINFWDEHRSKYNRTASKGANVKNPGANLLDGLKLSRGCLGSDPRDKLYGILALIYSSDVDGLIRPDYSLPCEHVFTNLAIHLYQENGPNVLKKRSTIHIKVA